MTTWDYVDNSKDTDLVYLDMAIAGAQKAKCPRNQFAAILVDRNGRVKGHGYNGTIAGQSNLCGEDACLRDRLNIESGTRSDIGCIHAEMNLIINSNHDDLRFGTVYVNGEPCLFCAKLLAQSGIARLVYKSGGYSTKAGIDLLVSCDVDCFHPITEDEKKSLSSD